MKNKVVSYSQYQAWAQCPHHWKLKYVDRVAEFVENIHVLFGTAMHDVIQEWLTVLFERTKKEAQALNLKSMLLEQMRKQFQKRTRYRGGLKVYPCSQAELVEFYQDGVAILEWLNKKATKFFPTREWELVGMELPLSLTLRPNLKFRAYLDVVLRNRNDGHYKIIDLKTSTRGWSAAVKKDKVKTNQLLLYKKYYAEQYNVSEDEIEVEFLILKRKLGEPKDYPLPRVSRFPPAHKKVSVNKAIKSFNEFIDGCFDKNGNHLTEGFKPTPSAEACRFCPFNNLPRLCDRSVWIDEEQRIKEISARTKMHS
jgi:hypothetical protein